MLLIYIFLKKSLIYDVFFKDLSLKLPNSALYKTIAYKYKIIPSLILSYSRMSNCNVSNEIAHGERHALCPHIPLRNVK